MSVYCFPGNIGPFPLPIPASLPCMMAWTRSAFACGIADGMSSPLSRNAAIADDRVHPVPCRLRVSILSDLKLWLLPSG